MLRRSAYPADIVGGRQFGRANAPRGGRFRSGFGASSADTRSDFPYGLCKHADEPFAMYTRIVRASEAAFQPLPKSYNAKETGTARGTVDAVAHGVSEKKRSTHGAANQSRDLCQPRPSFFAGPRSKSITATTSSASFDRQSRKNDGPSRGGLRRRPARF